MRGEKCAPCFSCKKSTPVADLAIVLVDGDVQRVCDPCLVKIYNESKGETNA